MPCLQGPIRETTGRRALPPGFSIRHHSTEMRLDAILEESLTQSRCSFHQLQPCDHPRQCKEVYRALRKLNSWRADFFLTPTADARGHRCCLSHRGLKWITSATSGSVMLYPPRVRSSRSANAARSRMLNDLGTGSEVKYWWDNFERPLIISPSDEHHLE